MYILITGVGNCGKSSFRRKLVESLQEMGVSFHQLDADRFTDVRDDRDTIRELRDSPQVLFPGEVVVVEDVHATIKGAVNSLDHYDLVFYVETDSLSYLGYWLSRGWRWFESGKLRWTAGSGWSGTKQPYDLKNLSAILRTAIRAMLLRPKWVHEDLLRLDGTRIVHVRSQWSVTGPKFTLKF